MAERLAAFTKETGDKPSYMAKDVLLRRLYETAYGIFNHNAIDVPPLALVTARQKDELFLYSKVARDMERFIDLGVFQATGTDYQSWMKMPVAEAELMLALVARKNKSESNVAGQVSKELQDMLSSEKAKKQQ